MSLKWCQPHWDALRRSIEDAGMGHLISRGGEAACARVCEEIEGTATDASFDPLLAAWARIDQCFAEPLGPRWLFYLTSEAGEVCTLCELKRLNAEKPHIVENWIGGCTRDLVAYCTEKGLIPARPSPATGGGA